MRLLLLLAALFALAAAVDLSGTYTSNYCSSPFSDQPSIVCTGAQFYICHDPLSGLLEGVYSQIGFVSGYVSTTPDSSSVTFRGLWIEAGDAGPPDSVNSWMGGYYSNFGPISLAFSGSSGSWTATGASTYNCTDIPFSTSACLASSNANHHTWSISLVDATPPSTALCWLAPSNETNSLNNYWGAQSANNYQWPICVSGQYSLGSFTYGTLEVGITRGPCFLDDTLCTYFYYEQNQVSSEVQGGIGLIRIVDNVMYSLQTQLSFYTTYPNIYYWTFGGGNSVTNVTWTTLTSGVVPLNPSTQPFPVGCSQYSYLLGSPAVMQAPLALLVAAALLLLWL